MVSVHGLLPLGCLPESLMVGSILVPWWGCTQIACHDKQCKIYLEHMLPCVHDVRFAACPMPFGFSQCWPASLMVCCCLFSQSGVALCLLPPLPAVRRDGVWLPPMDMAGGKQQWGCRMEDPLHLLEEVQRARLEISAPWSGGGGQRGAIITLCFSLNTAVDLATSSRACLGHWWQVRVRDCFPPTTPPQASASHCPKGTDRMH